MDRDIAKVGKLQILRKASQSGGNHGYQIKLERNKKRKASNDGRAAMKLLYLLE